MLIVSACGGNPEPPPPPAPQQAARPPAATPAPARPAAAPSAPANNNAQAEANMRATLAEMIFFDYDRSEIRADSRATLDRKARILRDAPTVRIRVEGHADERGSTEYNLALGSRRAESVRSYLVGLGISATRLETTSYGEGRPLQSGRSEASWSRNRRAEFVMTGGTLVSGG
jgi:peptidoglycan-associated lipoprotein